MVDLLHIVISKSSFSRFCLSLARCICYVRVKHSNFSSHNFLPLSPVSFPHTARQTVSSVHVHIVEHERVKIRVCVYDRKMLFCCFVQKMNVYESKRERENIYRVIGERDEKSRQKEREQCGKRKIQPLRE